MAFFLFVFFFVASVSSKSLDLTKVNVDELSSDAQKPVFPGAPSDDADDEHFDEDDSDALEEEDAASLLLGKDLQDEIFGSYQEGYLSGSVQPL
ncbi:unnamed protein product [Haemonchus placei]|uniref:Secreted protein n=1 Tax=Haemonchus placei TaxID=6290 RepID=A0A0N4X6A9_HAEPC|nr:unnamed protein product [Haemonchus placei]